MAWVRQLASGRWAATVYTVPGDDGSRRTESHPLRSVITKWAGDLESDVRRGVFVDPRAARTKVAEVWARYSGSRRLEKASRARDGSHWRVHVEPKWGRKPVGSILKPDVQLWINEMEAAHAPTCRDKACEGCRYGGWTIIASLNVLKAVLELAVDAGLIRSNPARRVKAPMPPEHEDRRISGEELDLILGRLDEILPGRRDASLFVETLAETGARWEEIAAVGRGAINVRTGQITIGPVMERDGTIRDYPKGARTRQAPGFRAVRVDTPLLAKLRPVVLATPPKGLVFTAPEGGPMRYPTWLRRVWNQALRLPVLDARGRRVKGEDGKALWTPLVDEPLPTPHDLRHEYGSSLADAGVEMHKRMSLMGHRDVRSGMRYTHAGEDRHDEAIAARRLARGG
jgi:integrase